jgi:hypothetical protein
LAYLFPLQAGDVFRVLDVMGMVRSSSFILLDGPTFISSAPLTTALTSHTERNKVDDNAVITIVMTETLPHRVAQPHTLLKTIISPSDGKLHAFVRFPNDHLHAKSLRHWSTMYLSCRTSWPSRI